MDPERQHIRRVLALISRLRGDPKNARTSDDHQDRRFWGALARTADGATLLPLRALPYRSTADTFFLSVSLVHYRVERHD